MGIEPTSSAWKAEVLPLNYTRTINREVENTEATSLPVFQISVDVHLSHSRLAMIPAQQSANLDSLFPVRPLTWWRG